MKLRSAIALAVLVSLEVAAISGPDLPSGPFCNHRCCDGRKDDCSHPILGTLCYCDVFCYRNGTKHDDCCPDYEPVCLGITTTPEPERIVQRSCEYNGRVYYQGQSRIENCNECKCVGTADARQQDRWDCARDACLVSEQIINHVNYGQNSWRASNYTGFWGRTLSDGIKYKLGTLPLSQSALRMIPDPSYTEKPDLPPSFDARHAWPSFISPVYDQGWCGSDWAVSTAAVASDRFAILSNGAEAVRLSAQQLVSCIVRRQQGCEGGYVDGAWIFARKAGLVDEECFPYTGPHNTKRCPRVHENLLRAGCRRPPSGRIQRYKTSPPKRFGSEDDIMYEIMRSGPVQAVMTVRHDFFHYRDGVYRHSGSGQGRIEGLHSVRILGWGKERGDKYWLVANSWGEDWGENGYVRIARGENESDIERFVIAPLAKVLEANGY